MPFRCKDKYTNKVTESIA